jgi:hypothetical protein
MSGTKIKVPSSMIDAFWKAYNVALSAWGDKSAAETVSYCGNKGLEAALGWLSENPIVPTNKQIVQCHAGMDQANDVDTRFEVSFYRQWQSRMFMAPEPGTKTLFETDGAVVLQDTKTGIVASDETKEGAAAKLERLIHRQNEFAKVHAPEPEVPEEIKELLWPYDNVYPTQADKIRVEGHNAGLLEAYRRGQQSKRSTGA